jgi:F-type H+-transporting ATPase subunit b
MRRLLLILLLVLAPSLLAQTDSTGASAAHGAESEAHEKAHPDEPPHADEGHHEKTYFGIPGWVLKILNMVLFIGALAYFVGGPVKTMFGERSAAIQRAAQEARDRRARSDQMAEEIQARLNAIEAEVRAIHDRAQAEGERQKRELIAAAEAESQKILQTARNEVANRLKHARAELTEFAGTLAAERAEQILREKMTDQDQKNLFEESLKEVGELRS